jgi:hypothetical protein
MKMELVAARAILSMAAKYRSEYLRDFYELNRKSIDQTSGANEPIAYLIPAGQGRDESVAKLIGSLIDQGIDVFRLDQELHLGYGPQILQRTNSATERLGSYRTLIAQTTAMMEVPAGSYIIFLSQPQRSNIRALFEPQIYPNRLTAAGEAERPYDVAGWTLPMQMGVDAPAVTAIREPENERKLTLLKDGNEVRADLALTLSKTTASPIRNPIRKTVRVGIYKGSRGNMDEGWTRFVFDNFNVPHTPLGSNELREGNLRASYDAIILPSQRTRDNSNRADAAGTAEPVSDNPETELSSIKSFVNDGGTLICFDGGCAQPIKQFGLPLRNVLEGVRSSEFYCPGSIVAIDLDNRHSLAQGVSNRLPAYFINSSAFETTDPAVRVVARYAKENLLMSGWLLGEEKLRGQIAMAEVSHGKGRVVLFAFRPQHRGQTWATFPLIWNAISASVN